jgi:hypothetical protein
MFESPSGIERNKKVQVVTASILLVLMLGFIVYTKLTGPDLESFGGIYRNECCSDIVIRDGHIIYKGRAFDIRMLTEKTGLTGEISGRFTRDGIQVSGEPTPIGFSGDGGQRSLSIRIDQRDYTFRQVESFAVPG